MVLFSLPLLMDFDRKHWIIIGLLVVIISILLVRREKFEGLSKGCMVCGSGLPECMQGYSDCDVDPETGAGECCKVKRCGDGYLPCQRGGCYLPQGKCEGYCM